MKKEKYFFLFFAILSLVTLSACKTDSKGNTLNAFSLRMNELCEDYKMTPAGYIYDSDKETISKFFTTDKREILVEFLINDDYELCRMNIVFDNLTKDNQYEVTFISHCIIAFTDNEELSAELLSEIDFYNAIYIPSNETRNKKIGDTEILLDVTESYTVITVEQNIL